MDESGERSPVEVEVGQDATVDGTRRSRVVTGVVAAMLVAGSGGLGFGLGRSVSDGDDARGADAPEAPVTTEAETLPPAPTVAPSTVAAGDVVTTDAPAEEGGSISAAEVVTGVPFPGAEAFDLVWEGVTESGYRLRLQTGPGYEMGYTEGPSAWQPAAFCYGSAQMRLTVDGPDVVDVAIGSWFTELYGNAEIAWVGDVGAADGRAMRGLVVQTGEEATEVRAVWTDGVELSAPVEGGAAVLVGGTGGAWNESLAIEVVGADGVIEMIEGGYVNRDDDPEWRAACFPPPPVLPDPGEQPVDPDAEQAAIAERFDLLWDQSIDRVDKPALLDDDTGVDEAADAVLAGDFGDTARTAVFTIEEFVFTAPDRAWFRYSIDTDVTFFSDRYGVARLGDDGWIFPRALMCQDLGLAGATCDPPFEQIYPPAWYEMTGGFCTYDDTGMTQECTGYEDSDIASW